VAESRLDEALLSQGRIDEDFRQSTARNGLDNEFVMVEAERLTTETTRSLRSLMSGFHSSSEALAGKADEAINTRTSHTLMSLEIKVSKFLGVAA
jgi:hypothetical protein